MKAIPVYCCILLASFGFTIKTYAQDTTVKASYKTQKKEKVLLSGKIINGQTGEPLASASIYFPDLRMGATSDTLGVYTIKNLPQGRYLVEVSFLGFSSILESVHLQGNVQKDFALSPTYAEVENVTITGVSAATSVKRTPIPVNIIRQQELNRGTSTNLIDALTKTPGVAQVSTGAAISKPFIRGLGYNRVVVVNDGIRQEGQQWGDEHGVEIDEYNVSRAEVLKGPASLMYGSDALAGVINFISIVPVAEGTVKGNLFGNYQTNNRQRGLHGDISGNTNGFIWGAYGSYKVAADYKNNYDGYVFNSKFNERNFGAYAGLNKTWGFTHWYISQFNQRVGLIEGERDSTTGNFSKIVNNNGMEDVVLATAKDFRSTEPYHPYQQIKHFKIAADNNFHLGNKRLTLTLAYQRNQRQEFGNVLSPKERALYFDLHTINYNFQFHLAENAGWKTSVGVNGMQQENKNRGMEALIPEYSSFDVGVFLYSQKRMEKLTLSGGIRFDNRSINSQELQDAGVVKFEKFRKNFFNISGSAGLSYEASKAVTLKYNIARGFRAPSIPELSSNGAHEGTNRYEYGEQDLKSETSFQIDGGIEVTSPHVVFSANVFYNGLKNFIYYRRLSSSFGSDSIIINGTEQFFAFRFDQNKTSLFGSEFSIDIHPHPLDWLHIESVFSHVRGRLNQEQDGSRNLPFIPATRLINVLKGEFAKKNKNFKNAYAKIELDNSFAQNNPFTGFNTETSTSGYSILNAGLGGDVLSKDRTLFSLYLSANNIANVTYQNHLSRLKYTAVNNVTGRRGVYNMGRNFSIKVNVPLTFKK
ncbi:MAG: TonB-dependent receptor [Niastella sp. SCN 39-18]|nr:TonB-dependent receptor [Sphingobacteriales bacterium]ODT52283.1 MAG: TonB-dependent receptor [Niastella sp. SCN 39-18]OJW10440.1 MAG: TonB-dependent receptor [Sphingobacteriales bacterium 39-19]